MLKPLITLAVLSAVAAGCHTVRSVQPAQLTSGRSVDRVWVTLGDQSTVTIDLPELYGDTLTGIVYGEPQRIALSDAKAIRARRSAPARTLALALAAGALAVSGFAYMQSRPDVGTARYCGNSIGSRPAPFTNCCPVQDTVPC
jgi:hypothetical protein